MAFIPVSKRKGGVLGEDGIVSEMAEASLHNDVLFESEKCYERAFHCAYANDKSLVGSLASANGGTATEYLVEWDGSTEGADRTVLETLRYPWSWTWQKLSSGSVFQCCGVGNAFQDFHQDFAGAIAGTSSTNGEYSLKDVWRSRSRPSRPLSLDRSGVACSHVLCCRMQ